jgi:hypothetical protein
MHHAPAVSYPVGRCRFRTGLVVASLLINVLTLSWWTWSQGWHVAQMAGWALGLAVAMLQARMLQRWPQGCLHWQGDHWLWQPEGDAQLMEAAQLLSRLQVVLDWQSGLLLCAQGTRKQWLWLDRSQAPWLWLDLRRAVWGHSQATAPISREIV